MRIALFGATGFIGTGFLERSLEREEDVSALVRDSASLAPRPHLEVIQGSIEDRASLDRVIVGADAVVSVLGPRRGDANPGDFLATSMSAILASMAANNVERLVTISGAAIRLPGERKGFPHNIASAAVSVMARSAYLAKRGEMDVLLASSAEWTAIRPTRVVAGEATGHPRVSLQAGDVGLSVTRGDVAQVLWEQLRSGDFVRKAPYVSS